ncbi:MAG: hypothetical protein QXP66_01030 [Candidatus Aenigmatarchaeota archaeon]
MQIKYLPDANSRIIESANCTYYQTKLNNRWVLHRERAPAVITPYHMQYYWYGIQISKEIAEGKISVKNILKIRNAEIRRAAMALAIEKITEVATIIDTFTPDKFKMEFFDHKINMYTLYRLEDDSDLQPFVFLEMVDPSKRPFQKYYIRVDHQIRTCKEAIAKSYGFETWEEYEENQIWV